MYISPSPPIPNAFSLSLFPVLTDFYPGGTGLAGTRMEKFWYRLTQFRLEKSLLKQWRGKEKKGAGKGRNIHVTTGGKDDRGDITVTTIAVRRTKLQSNRHHQQTNTQLFRGQMPFLSPNQQCQSTEGRLRVHLSVTNIWRWKGVRVGEKEPTRIKTYLSHLWQTGNISRYRLFFLSLSENPDKTFWITLLTLRLPLEVRMLLQCLWR